MYRGRRLTIRQLGGTEEAERPPPGRRPQSRKQCRPRIRHDIFMDWLPGPSNPYDVVFLQEPHYGLGRDFTWTVISSPDPQHRWAGVAVYVSERLASSLDVRCQEIVPGRLLHVRVPVGTPKQQLHLVDPAARLPTATPGAVFCSNVVWLDSWSRGRWSVSPRAVADTRALGTHRAAPAAEGLKDWFTRRAVTGAAPQ